MRLPLSQPACPPPLCGIQGDAILTNPARAPCGTPFATQQRKPGAGDDSGNRDRQGEGPGQIGLATRTRAKSKKPSQFKVLMLNDDYTPMEFVVIVLKRFFNMDLEQATRVMLHVHQRGVGVCGVFPYEIAETKVNQVMDFARENQHPCNARWKRRDAPLAIGTPPAIPTA
jgi:ATP-dependent Clp protease adaptor protein ClpS